MQMGWGRIVGFTVLVHAYGASANSPAVGDEFGYFTKPYQPYRYCHAPLPPATCEGENALLCSLIDKISLFATQDAKRVYLLDLTWALHRKRLIAAETEAENKLTNIGGPTWPPNEPPYSYSWLHFGATPAQIPTTISYDDIRCGEILKAAQSPPEQDTQYALAAYQLAIEGRTDDARRLLDREKAVPQEVERGVISPSSRTQRLAMAWAEIGDYQIAAKLVRNDVARIRGLVVETAVNHGDLDAAIRLVDPRPTTGWMHSSSAFAKLAITRKLIEAGRVEEARSLAEKWGVIEATIVGWKTRDRAVFSPALFISIDRAIALNQAFQDPIAAYDRLAETDARACRNAIAATAAHAGNPEGAQAVLSKGTDAGEFELRKPDGSLDFTSLNINLDIARAYADKGQANMGQTILDRLWDQFWSSPPSINPVKTLSTLDPETITWVGDWSLLLTIASAYGEIGRPEIGEERMNAVWAKMPPTQKSKAEIMGFMSGIAAASLVRRDQLPKAVELAEHAGVQQPSWYAAIARALSKEQDDFWLKYAGYDPGCPIEVGKDGQFEGQPD